MLHLRCVCVPYKLRFANNWIRHLQCGRHVWVHRCDLLAALSFGNLQVRILPIKDSEIWLAEKHGGGIERGLSRLTVDVSSHFVPPLYFSSAGLLLRFLRCLQGLPYILRRRHQHYCSQSINWLLGLSVDTQLASELVPDTTLNRIWHSNRLFCDYLSQTKLHEHPRPLG